MIELIEAHSYLSTPADTQTLYDGWLIRLSANSAKRANSVNFPEKSSPRLSVDAKIAHCERLYFDQSKPCIFRITPLAAPDWLQDYLIAKQYVLMDPTDVLIRDLTSNPPRPPAPHITLTNQPAADQLNALCRLTEKSDPKIAAFCESLDLIKIKTLYAFAYETGEIVSSGLATVDGNLMGLFEFATNAAHQRRGYAASITNALLHAGAAAGAKTAYLQVVQDNAAGALFWQNQHFNEKRYEYRYLIKEPPHDYVSTGDI